MVFNTTEGAKALADSDIRRDRLALPYPVLYNSSRCAGRNPGHPGAEAGGFTWPRCKAISARLLAGSPRRLSKSYKINKFLT